MNEPILLVHGGAWSMPDELVAAHERGIRNALRAGWAVLERKASSLDAVEAAVRVMEDDDTFDAGRGSFLTTDGRVQCDALMMDGATLRAGGVGCVERIRNPISAARKVLEESAHVYFVGEGAERFAAAHGIELIANEELVIDREREHLRRCKEKAAQGMEFEIFAHSHDTVGAVALDAAGNLAAATSTGGTLNKTPGRVGDASLIGCGTYADNQSAAVSTTGWGEPFMKLVLGKWAVDQIAAGATPEAAAWAAMDYVKSRLNGHGGIILLDRNGRMGMAHNTSRMAVGYRRQSGEWCAVKLSRP
ncbi:MAG TPA: isoaspartyl peptidase/L-asparaginase [Terriglobales bacterium]|nr:isoaspartyl peptidase/L-asparaginase [Terriglobales bacterium]